MGLPLEITLLPDLSVLKREKNKIQQTIGSGVEDSLGDLGGLAKGKGKGSKLFADILAKLIAIVASIIGLKALLDLKPLQAILKLFNSLVTAFLLPFGVILFNLLSPLLIGLLKLMPFWIKFFQDPVGTLKEFITQAIAAVEAILTGRFTDLVNSGTNQVAEAISSLGDFLTLKGVFGRPINEIATDTGAGIRESLINIYNTDVSGIVNRQQLTNIVEDTLNFVIGGTG